MLNDKEIISNLLSKDERLVNKTLEDLYSNLNPIVRKIVLINNGNSDDVSDVIQEGILSFYSNMVLSKSIRIKENLIINSLDEVVKISSYMYSVFRNIWFSKLRLNKFKSNKDLDNLSYEFEKDEEEDVYEYENLYIKKKQVYLDSLKKLDEKCKEILNLFWYKKLSFEDISKIMDHSNSKTSKQIKARCQKKLKEMCKQELSNGN